MVKNTKPAIFRMGSFDLRNVAKPPIIEIIQANINASAPPKSTTVSIMTINDNNRANQDVLDVEIVFIFYVLHFSLLI